MEIFIKAILITEKLMAWEYIHGQMVKYTMADGAMAANLEMENGQITMVINIKEIGLKIWLTDMVNIQRKQVTNI